MTISNLEIAKLRNKRKQKLQDFENQLKQVFGKNSVAYFDFEKGVRITKDVFSSRKFQNRTGRMAREEAVAYLDGLVSGSLDRGKTGIVLLSHHEYIGGVMAILEEFLTHALDLVEYDGDTVFFVDEHADNGLMFDKDDDGYEMYGWGSFAASDDYFSELTHKSKGPGSN